MKRFVVDGLEFSEETVRKFGARITHRGDHWLYETDSGVVQEDGTFRTSYLSKDGVARNTSVRRFAYGFKYGINPGATVRMTCKEPGCINPEHARLVEADPAVLEVLFGQA